MPKIHSIYMACQP